MEELLALKEQMGILQKKLEHIEKILGIGQKEDKAIKVLGFKLVYKTIPKPNGKIYNGWYAFRNENKKSYWVYVGKRIEKADEKIKNYCERKGISLDLFSQEKYQGKSKPEESLAKITPEESLAKITPEESLAKITPEESLAKSNQEEINFKAMREQLKKDAIALGGNRALARRLGMTESTIRRFLSGERKTLSPENIEKAKALTLKDGV